MSIRFACLSCRATYTVNDRDAGKKAECKGCGQRLQVPAPQRLRTVLGEEIRPAGAPAAGLEPPNARESEYPGPAREPDRYDDRAPARADPEADSAGRPGKAQAIAFIVLIGGGWADLWALGMVVLSMCYCLAWPGTYYSIVFAVLACIRGAELMGSGPGARRSPRPILVMQVVTIVTLDVLNLAAGVVGLVFLNDPAVDRYFARRGPYD